MYAVSPGCFTIRIVHIRLLFDLSLSATFSFAWPRYVAWSRQVCTSENLWLGYGHFTAVIKLDFTSPEKFQSDFMDLLFFTLCASQFFSTIKLWSTFCIFFLIYFIKMTFICSHVSLFGSRDMFLKISVFLMLLFIVSSNSCFLSVSLLVFPKLTGGG